MYSIPPSNKDTPLVKQSLSLLEKYPLVRGTTDILTVLAANNLCPLEKAGLSRECPLSEGSLYYILCQKIFYSYTNLSLQSP